MRRFLFLSVLFGLLPGISADETKTISFNRDIRPLLSQHCFACHGPDAHDRKADLGLHTFEAATADLGGTRAITPGDPNASELMARIFSEDPDEVMPPPETDKTLTPDEKKRLRRWIETGAKYETAWAYVPPRPSEPTKIRNDDWPRQWIDNYILAELEATDRTPSPDADPATLVRRLHFDITGLPPPPAEIASFTNLAERVDDLLARPAFGERMAVPWLDLVRYADTVGYHGDQDHNISLYRDYVIAAFNRNLRFDQFTREQLAGDLLPDPTRDQTIATGYNRLLQTSHEGGVQKKEYLTIYGADRVRNVSAVWMGATVGCAQCHDHKYDPYTAKDFYALEAFFADIDDARHFREGSNSLPTKRPPELMVFDDPADEKRWNELAGKKGKEVDAERKKVRAKSRTTMITVALKTPRVTRLLPRGNWLDESGPVIQPAVPEFMGRLETDARATRLDLANWLTEPDPTKGIGGLTARVFVNRVWAMFFGHGLSRALDDFGGQGQPPQVHAALLDQLALAFIESGWDVKALVRLLVTSRAYAQSSLVPETDPDPENHWLSRQARFRLPAEMIRDNALAVSGLLVEQVGGDSVKPYQPAGYYRHLNFPTRKYGPHLDQRQYRRGVYVHWQRQFLHPMLRAFDAPTREECTAERPRSNTPVAAMVLLNDPTFVEAARAFAARLLCEHDNDNDRIRAGFEIATSRGPTREEHDLLNQLLRTQRTRYAKDPKAAADLHRNGQFKTGDNFEEKDLPELAAWTAVTRALLNLNETITRN